MRCLVLRGVGSLTLARESEGRVVAELAKDGVTGNGDSKARGNKQGVDLDRDIVLPAGLGTGLL